MDKNWDNVAYQAYFYMASTKWGYKFKSIGGRPVCYGKLPPHNMWRNVTNRRVAKLAKYIVGVKDRYLKVIIEGTAVSGDKDYLKDRE